ncbi:hypothetical protein HYQ46_010143 [Verticillium longisporum]|nr:hypothetical protein HYQ46_010143 [Verticillium longisporum]
MRTGRTNGRGGLVTWSPVPGRPFLDPFVNWAGRPSITRQHKAVKDWDDSLCMRIRGSAAGDPPKPPHPLTRLVSPPRVRNHIVE